MMATAPSVVTPSQNSVSTAVAAPGAATDSISVDNSLESIRRHVLEIIQHETNSPFDPEQLPGSFGRVPIEVSFRLFPVAFDGTTILLGSKHSICEVALTRDLSSEGVAFEHPSPIDERFALAFFPALESQELALLFEQLWSKKMGTVENLTGGRFIGVVSLKEGFSRA